MHFSLYAISLVLCFCGTIAAQQTLVEYKDKNDPCRRFKMRILVPANNNADYKLPVKKIDDEIDYQMVWNPCLQHELQLAFSPPPPAPDPQESFLVQRSSFRFQFPTAKSAQKKQSRFMWPQSPSAFEFKWPQQE